MGDKKGSQKKEERMRLRVGYEIMDRRKAMGMA